MVKNSRSDGEGTEMVRSPGQIRPPRPEPSPSLEEAFAVFRLHKWSILLITLLTGGLALLVSIRQTPIYESQAKILVPPGQIGAGPPESLNMATEALLASSVSVADIVADNLSIAGAPGDLLGALSVNVPSGTEILEVSYQDADPLKAQRRAQGFAEGYLEYRQVTLTAKLGDSAEVIKGELQTLEARLDQLRLSLASTSLTDSARAVIESEVLAVKQAILDRELTQIAQTDPAEVFVGTIVQPASLPSSPVSPDHVVNAAFGLVVGLALGIGLAFLRDRLSGRVRSVGEIEEYLDAPVLGSIPKVSTWRNSKEAYAVTLTNWRSPSAEAYRFLRTSVLAAISSDGVKSIVVTSAYGGEGKSSTVANLGVVLAMAGRQVSLVSADLRRPRLQEFFGTEGRRGLSDILAGGAKLGDVLQEITLATLPWAHVPRIRLRILPSGPILQDPAELLASERMTKILRELEETSDIVLIDVPPFLPVTDALAVASVADGVILVLGPKGLTESSLISARQQLDKVETLMLGTVLNRPEPFISETDYSY